MPNQTQAFIALGSSIGNAEGYFDLTEKELQKHQIEIIKKSTNVISEPLGGIAQNKFTNAVWEIKIPPNFSELLQKSPSGASALGGDLEGDAFILLSLLKQIEQKAGRNLQAQKWSDRSLDLDILYIEDLEISTEILIVPHKEIPNRNFVLEPWIEISGKNFCLPNKKTLGQLHQELNSSCKTS